MDALPVTEQTDVPFKSTVTTDFRDEKVGVMHACGHDGHVAILLGVAEALVKMKDTLPGQVLFVFQPAEEGPPEGERGGARVMLEQGVFNIAEAGRDDRPAPDGVAQHRSDRLQTRSADGGIGCSSPSRSPAFRPMARVPGPASIRSPCRGRSSPGLQTIVSRQIDITQVPAVITVGAIKGGIRFNIIPDSVEMIGTVRNFDPQMRADIVKRMETTASNIAEASGAKAVVKIRGTKYRCRRSSTTPG